MSRNLCVATPATCDPAHISGKIPAVLPEIRRATLPQGSPAFCDEGVPHNPHVTDVTVARAGVGTSGKSAFHRTIPWKPHLSPVDPPIYPQRGIAEPEATNERGEYEAMSCLPTGVVSAWPPPTAFVRTDNWGRWARWLRSRSVDLRLSRPRSAKSIRGEEPGRGICGSDVRLSLIV